MTDTTVPVPGRTPTVEELNSSRGALPERMGIEILEATPERVVARMPVEGNTQPYGILHGGASVVLAETVGSIGSALHAGSLGKISVGLDINATHHRAARSGWVSATAVPVTLGGTVTCYDVTLTDEEGRRTCTSRITCLLRDLPPGA
ncbi:MAG: PaaI family thioesterase [Janibacter sp.]